MRTWSWTRVALSAIALVAAGLFWLNFAPTRLGGDSIYVVTSGISMEPRFHTGDLAVLRPASTYKIGEIVGYKSPRIGIVMHRIIGEERGHFLMKGDNNNFVDEYHPAPSDVVGRLWLHVPKAGGYINNKRGRDTTLAIAAMTMGGIIGVPAERERRRRRKKFRRGETSPNGAKASGSPSHRRRGRGPVMAVIGVSGQIAASVICLIALAALVLGAFSYTRSTTTVTTEHLSYRQTGIWSYSAAAKGDVYANGTATTGQPIYPAVAPVVDVNFAYKFDSVLSTHLTGQGELTAVLTSSDGWSHTLPIGPKTSFSGTAAQLKGTLNLRVIERYLASVEVQTGQYTGSGAAYSLALEPVVHVSGLLGNSSVLPQIFNPPLNFTLQANQVELNNGQNGTAAKTLAQLVQSSVAGSVSVPRTKSAKLSFLGLKPSVLLAREIAALALLACVLALLCLGVLLHKASRAPEADRIEARYGPILVAVERPEALGEARSVAVASIEDLVKIAEHQGRMILHCQGGSGRDYFVQDQSLTYLFSLRDQPSAGRVTGDSVPAVTPNSAGIEADAETSPRFQA